MNGKEIIIDFLGTWDSKQVKMPCMVHEYLGRGETEIICTPCCPEELYKFLLENKEDIRVAWTRCHSYYDRPIVDVLTKLNIKWSTNVFAEQYCRENCRSRYVCYWNTCQPNLTY